MESDSICVFHGIQHSKSSNLKVFLNHYNFPGSVFFWNTYAAIPEPTLFPRGLSYFKAEMDHKRWLKNLERNDHTMVNSYWGLHDRNFNPTVPAQA